MNITFVQTVFPGTFYFLLQVYKLVKVWPIMDDSANSPNCPAAKHSHYTVVGNFHYACIFYAQVIDQDFCRCVNFAQDLE